MLSPFLTKVHIRFFAKIMRNNKFLFFDTIKFKPSLHKSFASKVVIRNTISTRDTCDVAATATLHFLLDIYLRDTIKHSNQDEPNGLTHLGELHPLLSWSFNFEDYPPLHGPCLSAAGPEDLCVFDVFIQRPVSYVRLLKLLRGKAQAIYLGSRLITRA